MAHLTPIALLAALTLCCSLSHAARMLQEQPQQQQQPQRQRPLFVGVNAARRELQQGAGDGPELEMEARANIAVITTGGTIASVRGANGQLLPAANGTMLLAAVPGLDQIVNITSITAAARIDSSTASPAFWIRVATVILEQLSDPLVDGVLLLHGTDTLEQTAWFLQCVDGIGNQDKPVVVTGAMRGADNPFADGPGNIMSAAVVAASPGSAGQGVLVVFNDQVMSARFVTKADANHVGAFASINGGAKLASVVGSEVIEYFHVDGPGLCPGFPLPAELAPVALQEAYPGVDGSVLSFYKERGVAGIVIDGLGAGNIGPGLAEGLSAARSNSSNSSTAFSVVVTRRTANGITEASYGCQGCLGNLTDVAMAGNLDAIKARIVLMLALSQEPNITTAGLQDIYDAITYPHDEYRRRH